LSPGECFSRTGNPQLTTDRLYFTRRISQPPFFLAIFHRSGTIAAMPFSIRTVRTFAAAHQLRLYDGSLEPLHGHNWRVEVSVRAENLDSIGVVMDFHELERVMEEIVGPLHNRHLNELTMFAGVNPTTENVALHIGKSLRLPAGVTLDCVEVWETAENSAIYWPAAS
jgi:6-pyruvoyltetrahydropterin/6-carboxytetrahydropterin synthase